MLKTVHRYEQTAARLVVEGYPDLSDGQEGDTIGILSGWKLQLVGAPELEGTRDHLEAMMAAVMPYARHQLSGIGGRFGADQSFVGIKAVDGKHQLQLRSSREGVKPLQLLLDDADDNFWVIEATVTFDDTYTENEPCITLDAIHG